MSALLQQLNVELDEVVVRVRRSLVQVRSGDRGAGAGTIWHPNGLVVTNAHVVRSRRLRVTLPDGTTRPARLLAHDTSRDLAALMVEATDLPAIELGESRSLQPGQWVLALGHPWGVSGSVTAGVIIGVGSGLPEMPPFQGELIAVSLRLRPGYSGGPLIDGQGRLVGVNTMMAVPVHEIKAFLRRELGSAVPAQRADVAGK